jgi:hypothetical protein
MKKLSLLVCVTLALGMMATTVLAHHSFTMFNREAEEVVVGEVVRWAFNSPHTAIYIRDGEGTVWGFEGSAPPSALGRVPSMDGFTFQPGDTVTVIHCPLFDGRPGGAIGRIVSQDNTWYNPSDGGCGPNEEDWRNWLPAGYLSKADAEAAAG